jgi:phosphoglycolate phosphatase
MTAVLWDLDGTLVDSTADLADAVDGMLSDHDLPALGPEVVGRLVGEGAKNLVDRAVARAGGVPAPVHLERFLVRYRARPVARTRAYAGIAEIVRGVVAPQAVVTNKPEDISRTILDRLGLLDAFVTVVGGDTVGVRKPRPEPVQAAMRACASDTAVLIGDGPADVGAARAAGIACIGVLWGISRPEGAEVQVAEVGDLAAALAARGLLRYR